MARFPVDTAYAGPRYCYDDHMQADDLLRRLAYGLTPPMVPHRKPLSAAFYGRLFDALANQHAVLVKAVRTEQGAAPIVKQLRAELPDELYQVSRLWSTERGEWLVFVHNRITEAMWRGRGVQLPGSTDDWIGAPEVGRVLRVSTDHARHLMRTGGIAVRRMGGRNVIYMRRQDLPILANRPHRWKRKKVVQL